MTGKRTSSQAQLSHIIWEIEFCLFSRVMNLAFCNQVDGHTEEKAACLKWRLIDLGL